MKDLKMPTIPKNACFQKIPPPKNWIEKPEKFGNSKKTKAHKKRALKNSNVPDNCDVGVAPGSFLAPKQLWCRRRAGFFFWPEIIAMLAPCRILFLASENCDGGAAPCSGNRMQISYPREGHYTLWAYDGCGLSAVIFCWPHCGVDCFFPRSSCGAKWMFICVSHGCDVGCWRSYSVDRIAVPVFCFFLLLFW